MNKKFLAMALALVLLIGGAVSGSLAWLTDKTDAVKNVFTDSDINITLEESNNLNLTMIPGHTITKDPKVTVATDSEDCYLFIKIVKSENYATYLADYEVDEKWTKLEDGVYYIVIDTADEKGIEIPVLENNSLTVNSSVTKAQMDAIDGKSTDGTVNQDELDTRPTLTFTAYAVQYWTANGQTWTDAAAAWAEASK